MKFSSHKKFRYGGLLGSISSFLFRRTKSTVSRVQFSARYKIDLEKSHYCQHGRLAND